MQVVLELPLQEPSKQAKSISNTLTKKIIALIEAQGGNINFASYMQHALYTPKLGYYCNGSTKFGSGGDFVTAPELGNLFANCLANQIAQILPQINSYSILEIGAGTGKLACDLLLALNNPQHHHALIQNYYILEPSADLKYRQQQYIAKTYPNFLPLVTWIDNLPTQQSAFSGVIIANEVLDAFPVHRFSLCKQQGLQEICVKSTADKLFLDLMPADHQLQNKIAAYNLPVPITGYNSELNCIIPGWIKSISDSLLKGVVLIFDYGFPRAEYYHPDRNNGTLMCHYQHYCHPDPFFYPGLQDITSHVDFTLVAESAANSDFAIDGYTNLASFLINCGLTNLLQNSPHTASNQQAIQLTSPAEMGELFKVLAISKNFSPPYGLQGFANYNKLNNL